MLTSVLEALPEDGQGSFKVTTLEGFFTLSVGRLEGWRFGVCVRADERDSSKDDEA